MAIKPEDPNKPKWKPALQNEVKSVELSTLFIVILVAISNRPKISES